MERNIVLCDLTHMGQGIASDSFPLGIGCIASYLESRATVKTSVHLVKFPDDVAGSISKYRPAIVGFSNYVWNYDLSRQMAMEIKKHHPDMIIIFGGPNFHINEKEQEAFLRKNNFIDFYIEGEGERPFTQLVESLYANNLDVSAVKKLPNPSVRTICGGSFISNNKSPRIENLDDVPSPYLTGKMDSFFEHNLMPLIQTTRGCPFTCTYCVEGGDYYNKVVRHSSPKIIEDELSYISRRATRNKQLFIADSNFGMYDRDLLTAKIIRSHQDKSGFPHYIHVATGKNQKHKLLEIARTLKGKLRLSGSVQSLDKKVLENIKRKNISTDQLLELAEEAHKIGANSYSEIILGLPGDSVDAHMYTMRRVIDAGFNFVLPWTLMLLKGSELSGEPSIGKYNIARKYRVLPRCFGKYSYNQKKVYSGEVEEVCVSNDTLDVGGYLECRMFTLTTALFYNDKIFSEIVENLRCLGISPFSWLLSIHKARGSFSDSLQGIYNNFKNDTLDELWESPDALYTFLRDRNNMQKYISGEKGINLMYYYRSRALINNMQELNDAAFDKALALINKERPDLFATCKDYFTELKRFSFARKLDLFNLDLSYSESFKYDFQNLIQSDTWNYDHAEKARKDVTFHFFHSETQKKTVREQLNVFGSNATGLAKALSRINISKMYRTIRPVER